MKAPVTVVIVSNLEYIMMQELRNAETLTVIRSTVIEQLVSTDESNIVVFDTVRRRIG